MAAAPHGRIARAFALLRLVLYMHGFAGCESSSITILNNLLRHLHKRERRAQWDQSQVSKVQRSDGGYVHTR